MGGLGRTLTTLSLALAVGLGSAWAGKPSFGGGSSGKPSGGSGKPSFGGGSSGKPSGGGFSTPKPSSGGGGGIFGGGSSRPPAPSGGGIFGGGSSRPSSPPPVVTSPPRQGGGGIFGGGSSSPLVQSGGIFGGGSSRPGGKPDISRIPEPTRSGGGIFGGGSSNPPLPGGSGKPTFGGGSAPQRPPFSSVPAKETSRPEVREGYRPAPAPQPTYRVPDGPSVTIDPGDRRVQEVRRRTDYNVWTSRPQRIGRVYQPYYGRPVVYYSDPFHPYMNYWILNQPLNLAALWIYHHQAAMDRRRLDYYYAQQPALRAEVDRLRASGLTHDPTYTPPGLDHDLMYGDEYVDAAYNPQPVPAQSGGGYSSRPGFGLSSGMFVVLMIVGVIAFRSIRAKLGI